MRKLMTMAEFLDWEQRQELRHEFDGFQPVAMTGGSIAHGRLQRNIAFALTGALRGTPCEFLPSDVQLRLESSVRYADGMVVCGSPSGLDPGISNPVVLFEVISPSTAATDRIAKTREYQATPSVQRYIILEQERIAATVFARRPDGWSGQVVAAGEVLDMPEIGVSLLLDELYTGLEPTGG